MRLESKPKVGYYKSYLGAMQKEHGGSKKSWADIVEVDGKLQSDDTLSDLDDAPSRGVKFSSKAVTMEGSQIKSGSRDPMLEKLLDLINSRGDSGIEQGEASDERRIEATIGKNMPNSQTTPTHGDNGFGFHGENDNIASPGIEVPQADLEGVPIANPIDVSSHIALNTNLGVDPEGSVKRVLIDPGSSSNIIRSRVVEQLGLQDQIVLAARVLNGFNMAIKTTKGEIILPVNIAGTIQETKFHVMEGDMRYNALFGRPWIHNMRAVPLTLHQMLKFPTPDGVKMVYGEQHATKEIFAVDEVIPISALSSTKGSESKGKQKAK
ncbi:uncharacterized protein [Nicotiana tomentosiformis]|uniref:uncharacterized protein n=1 Tax=Nicotiana tomentosiformis TaxID=4098 RepID=UPI00388C541A